MMFFFPIARAMWFTSEMSLRVDQLPLNFTAALLSITEGLPTQGFVVVCNTLSCIWKARNEYVFSGKSTIPQRINMQTKAMQGNNLHTTNQLTRDLNPYILIPAGTSIIQMDGSWDAHRKAGTGMLVFNNTGTLIHARYKSITAPSPLHAEALAMLEALQFVQISNVISNYILCSDCRVLVQAVTNNSIEELSSSEAAETVAECMVLYQACLGRILVQHTKREALSNPHKLANCARSTRQNFSDSFRIEMDIEMKLSAEYFKITCDT